MGRADQRTIDAGTPVSVLMERAGRAVAWEVRRSVDGTYGRRVVVVCGKGNNGGDGLVAARVLTGWGMRAHVVELAGGVDRAAVTQALASADVVIDAMYGTGFRGVLERDAAWIATCLDGSSAPIVSVDVPSGIDGLTGAVRGVVVHAQRTVTFAARKPGLVFEPGRSHAGVISVVDIGIDLGPDGDVPPPLGIVASADVRGWLPPRPPDAHKWIAAVMVVGGSAGMIGAPMLVSHAAMRAGAGIVWCGLPGEAAARQASGGEVVTRVLPASAEGMLAPTAADTVLANIGRFAALAVGPGLGRDPSVATAVCSLVAEARVPLVLDADGLNALGGNLEPLRARRMLDAPVVLTPHDGEYVRLAGRPVGDDRIAAARRLADLAHAVVLLKGPGTVIAEPERAGTPGRVVLNPTGSAALATAGTGDVLTGIIAGFLARGMPAFEAAAAAAWIHGAAADLVAGGATDGLIAGDVVEAIPSTLRALTRPA